MSEQDYKISSIGPQLTIGTGEVHVWRIHLERLESDYESFCRVLSFDENAEAERFRFVRDRNRYVISHGALRRILGTYIDVPADALTFTQNQYGKPKLATSNHATLTFNLSHSQQIALIAISRGRAVGIDVEYVNEGLDWQQLAGQVLSPVESHLLYSLTPELWRRAFFTCWTRKEAYIKAKGIGLSLPLTEFAVSPIPGSAGFLDGNDISRWSIRDIDAANGYAAALVAEGDYPQMTVSNWRGGVNHFHTVSGPQILKSP